MFVQARGDITIQTVATGEAHEEISDPAFYTGRLRNRAGSSSHGHASQGRGEQQQACEKEENPREPWYRKFQFFQSEIIQAGAFQSDATFKQPLR